MEAATGHGFLSATQKGYAIQRQRELARLQSASSGGQSRADGAWFNRMAIDFGQLGVSRGGPSSDGPLAIGVVA